MTKNLGKSGKALATRGTTELADWEQQEATHARDVRSKETLGVPRVTTRGGVFKIDDKPVGTVLKLAVVATKHEKSYFHGKFDPQKPATPDCYAFGDEESSMVANDAARDWQNRQWRDPEDHSKGEWSPCKGCKHNEFGTAEIGRGKRCKDYRRLLVVSPVIGQDGKAKLDPDAVQKTQVRLLQVPPSSLRSWGEYVKSLTPVSEGGLGLTRTGSVSEMIVKVTIAPLTGGVGGGHGLSFEPEGQLPREAHQALVTRRKAAEELLTQPYPDISDGEKEAPEAAAQREKISKKLKRK